MKVKPGQYRHSKGRVYQVVGVARHSETLEELVVYKDEKNLWVRPKRMFEEKVVVGGKKVPRFKFLGGEPG
ncbi:MAG: hypothetical protein A2784_04025 [Candidatus Chisholmbacteria bacterium RIFCSPHIGHO2_01_FULL_48_12]|uniref:DUF1653 domain-containing protein n=1 Tax=Candidatus Chisholmbacteria bacterium RIFCSPHIGHO2_01_FULL_48_12 TaxID=1797589 RepID=A0A1G1VRP6_9BACT|nr:MAG: hypothetical protein A2784_04025 [Candidatus Chisholmbacteria bacterium RIFCSPHIGHO2_01_FULL_48_12]